MNRKKWKEKREKKPNSDARAYKSRYNLMKVSVANIDLSTALDTGSLLYYIT